MREKIKLSENGKKELEKIRKEVDKVLEPLKQILEPSGYKIDEIKGFGLHCYVDSKKSNKDIMYDRIFDISQKRMSELSKLKACWKSSRCNILISLQSALNKDLGATDDELEKECIRKLSSKVVEIYNEE